MIQIASDYAGLPDLRTMELHEIRFFYRPLTGSLIDAQLSAKKHAAKRGAK